jgi:two-component system invasion response regulator UvrY
MPTEKFPTPGDPSRKIKVLVADDHAIVRAGVRQILAGQPDIVVAGEAVDGREALQQLRQGCWSVLLLDLSMPGKCGIELLKQIRNEFPKLPVLILSAHREDQYAVRSLRAGAAGYLSKEGAPQLLLSAVRKVAKGERYISATLAERLLVDWDETDGKPLHSSLSDREYQIFEMLASGKDVPLIAKELCLSVRTISTYKTSLLHKMGMKNTLELVRYALENQLVDPSVAISVA